MNDRSRFVSVPKPKTGIKPGCGKRETQPGNVVNDRSRFVPVPKPRTGIKPGSGKRETQPSSVRPNIPERLPERFSGRPGSLYTDS